MPSTYTPIATHTASGTISDYTFTSISGTYTDLVIVWNGKCTGGGTSIDMQFNSDTGSNYSNTRLNGTGSSATSDRTSSQTATRSGLISTADSMGIIQIQNYSNSTTYKTQINRAGQSDGWVTAGVGLWRSTAAITSVKLFPSGASFTSGTTFTLYGIKAA